jgi:hypothetical protein
VASLAPIAALLAAILVAWVGWNNLKHQQTALRVSVQSDARNLRQKRQADGRSEWWRRTQWALEATASDDPVMSGYGAGLLSLLAKSDMAGPEDKALLDAVWEGTSTEMKDEGIEQLIRDALDQEGLTEEESASLRKVIDQATLDTLEQLKEQARNLTHEDMAAMLKQYEEPKSHEGADESSVPAPTEPVDGGRAVGDNEPTKEEADG